MPKLYTSNYPSSGYASEALMRSELQKIEDAFEDVVPRIQNIDSPQLQADIDMNNYDLLNVKNIDVQGLTLDGGTLQDEIKAGAQSVISEVEDRVTDAQVAAAAAQLARNVAEGYADDSAQLHEEVEIFRDQSQANAESVQSNLDSFNFIWHGPQATEPTKEEAGLGSIYYNTTDSTLYFCYGELFVLDELFSLEWRPVFVDESNLGNAAFKNFTTMPNTFSSFGRVRSVQVTADDLVVCDAGTKCMVMDKSTKVITSYDLSTPNDISTLSSATGTLDGSSQVAGLARGFDISRNGLHVVMVDTEQVYRWSLSTPFDLSTATYVSANSLGVSALGVSYNPDGSFLYIPTAAGNVARLTLHTAYDTDNTGPIAAAVLNVGTISGNITGFRMDSSGSNGYLLSTGGTMEHHFTTYPGLFTTALSSLQHSESVSIPPLDSFGLGISEDGSFIYSSHETLIMQWYTGTVIPL